MIERRNQLDSVIAKLDHGEGLPAKSIVELTAKIAELDKTVAQDKIQRNLIQQLQKRISSNSQETQRLQKEIFTAESETVGKEKLRADRLEAYRRLFSLWKDEQRTLELLYKPVQEKLRAGDEEEKQLDFYIRWNVELDSWIDRGNSLFDQRRGHPFASTSAFKSEVDKILVPAWKSGDPAASEVCNGHFLRKVERAQSRRFSQTEHITRDDA